MEEKKQRKREDLDFEDQTMLYELRVLSVLLEDQEEEGSDIIGLEWGLAGLLSLIEDQLEDRLFQFNEKYGDLAEKMDKLREKAEEKEDEDKKQYDAVVKAGMENDLRGSMKDLELSFSNVRNAEKILGDVAEEIKNVSAWMGCRIVENRKNAGVDKGQGEKVDSGLEIER